MFQKWFKKTIKTTLIPKLEANWTPRNYHSLSQQGFEKNVIVYRCISLIAKSLASIPLLVYEGENECSDHPLLKLLKQPYPDISGFSFFEKMTSYYLLSGNVYIYSFGNLEALYILSPERVSIKAKTNGEIESYIYEVQSKKIIYDPLAILHIKTFHPRSDWYGFSPVEAASASVDQHNAVANHNLSLLQNGGRPTGALILEDSLSEEQRKRLRSDLETLYEGTKNAGRIMLLEGTFKWQELGLSPKDLDFLPGKTKSAEEIAACFGVPSILVGLSENATYNNYKEARIQLWEDTVIPLFKVFLDAFNTFFSRYYPNTRIDFDIDAIPALSHKREETWKKLNDCHFLTINEKRQALGYSPLPDGDVLG